jgi:hypothetical protein
MDDVVADWRVAAEDLLKLKFPNNDPWARIPNDKWAELKRNSRFYRTLPLIGTVLSQCCSQRTSR